MQNRRFVAIVTQLPTLLAVRAGVQMDALLWIYSVVFILYYLAVYVLIAKWLRNEQVALMVPLLYILLAARSFYWAQSELPQALAALLLFYVGVARQAPLQLRFSTLALAALVPVFIFGHPLAIFPFLFVWAYDWLLNRRWRDWAYYGLLALGLLMYWYHSALVPPGSYEDTNMTFQGNLKQFFPHYFRLDSFKEFWHLCLNNYVALPLLLVLLTGYYLRQRTSLARLRLLLVWGSVAGYVFIINVSKPGFTELTYLDNLFLPLAFFIGIPFALELLPAFERAQPLGWRAPQLAATVLGIVLATRLLVVYSAHSPYTGYQHWLQRLMAYTRPLPEHRYLLDSKNVDPATLRAGYYYWASSYETMLLSARPSPDSVQVLYITTELSQRLEPSRTPGIVLGTFTNMPAKELTTSYFRLANNAAGYCLLNTPPPAADTAALRPYIAARRATQLALLDLPSANNWHTVRVRISPPPGQLLHSGLNTNYPTILRSRFLTSVGWPAEGSTVEMPLEVDVDRPWVQDVPLSRPSQPGKYLLKVGLISRNYQDWPVLVRIPVEIK